MLTFINSTKGKITVACIVLTLILLSAAVFVFVLQPQSAYRTIVVAEIDGQVLVSNDEDQETLAYAGMALYDGDTVTVADSATLTIALDGDKYMVAEGGTKFRLEASGKIGSDKTVIHLEAGAALTRIKNKLNDHQSYVVETPISTIAVRGTVFYVQITKDETGKLLTNCDALGGRVEVTPIDENGVPSEDPVNISAGASVGVIEIMASENNDLRSSTFIRGQDGSVEQPVDYTSIPKAVIDELIDYLDDGQELDATKEELAEYAALAEAAQETEPTTAPIETAPTEPEATETTPTEPETTETQAPKQAPIVPEPTEPEYYDSAPPTAAPSTTAPPTTTPPTTAPPTTAPPTTAPPTTAPPTTAPPTTAPPTTAPSETPPPPAEEPNNGGASGGSESGNGASGGSESGNGASGGSSEFGGGESGSGDTPLGFIFDHIPRPYS